MSCHALPQTGPRLAGSPAESRGYGSWPQGWDGRKEGRRANDPWEELAEAFSPLFRRPIHLDRRCRAPLGLPL